MASNPPSLRDVFNREVKKAVADFPALEGRFVFVNVAEDQTIASIDAAKTPLFRPEQFNYVAAQIATGAKDSGTSQATKVKEAGLSILAFVPLPYKIFAGRDQDDEMEAVAEFDHELGHLVVEGAFSSPDKIFRETAADIFAALRHVQRYGGASRAAEKGGWHRAFDFIMSGDADHFTTFGLDAAAAVQDAATLTPQQAAELARKLAQAHTPDAATISRLTEAFAPARDVMQATRNAEATLKEIARITLESGDDAIFRLGSRALRPFLDDQVGTIHLAGPEWDDVRRRIADHREPPPQARFSP